MPPPSSPQAKDAALQERLKVADDVSARLHRWEIRWRDRQQFLESHGYMLRPRYHPGWSPSWRGTGKHPLRFEDAIGLPDEGQRACIYKESDDWRQRIIYCYHAILPPLRGDPDNHCVPIYDIFQDADDERVSYMVMPFLRLIDDPPFEIIENVLDFVDQILEGLVFMHKQGVAHRDCSYKNLMMDGSALFPQGFHPVKSSFLPDTVTPAQYLSRSEVSVRYYYVDFGISVLIAPDVQPKLALGAFGRDQEVPELSTEIPYDPFKVDIFIIGNVFRRDFHDNFSNLNFLIPLIESMTAMDPSARPDAVEALARWKIIRRKISVVRRRWRLKSRTDSWIASAVFDTVSLVRTTNYLVRRLLSFTVDMQG